MQEQAYKHRSNYLYPTSSDWQQNHKIKGIYLVTSLVSRPYVGQAPLFIVEMAPDVFLFFFLLIQGARGGGIHKHEAKAHHILISLSVNYAKQEVNISDPNP